MNWRGSHSSTPADFMMCRTAELAPLKVASGDSDLVEACTIRYLLEKVGGGTRVVTIPGDIAISLSGGEMLPRWSDPAFTI